MKRRAEAARLYGAAFAAAPRLAAELNRHRYNAACAAVLAAGDREGDTGTLGFSDRIRWREMAFGWLEAELAAHEQDLASDPEAATRVRGCLEHWLGDPDLSGVRDARELLGLPDAERRRWERLWSDVRGLMVRAARQ
jgi:hypothetical protein